MLKKNTKYIPSTISSDKNNKKFFIYEPYIGCANKPTFSVEISYCYTVKSPATDFDEEKYYSRIIISVPCNSPKEVVDYAMNKWEDEAKKEQNVRAMFDVCYDFRFINVVRVSVQIKNEYWE